MEIARRQAIKEQKKKEKEESGKKPGHMEPEQKEEEEEELPPIYIPEDPSPLFCGFYSQPSQFWLSMVHTSAKRHSQTPKCTCYKCV